MWDGAKEPHDVVGQHGHHLVVVPCCLYVVHHSEECILGQLAWDASIVGWGYEAVLSWNVCQSSCLGPLKGFAKDLQQLDMCSHSSVSGLQS